MLNDLQLTSEIAVHDEKIRHPHACRQHRFVLPGLFAWMRILMRNLIWRPVL